MEAELGLPEAEEAEAEAVPGAVPEAGAPAAEGGEQPEAASEAPSD
jgi:hypothetical protein